MSKYELVATCLLGVEGIVAQELKMLECENVRAENGRVLFSGEENIIARANINSRYSERILILLGEFKATTFEELFQNVKKLPWEKFVGKEDIFPVKGSALNSKLMSVPDCQKIIKKAVVERLKNKYKIDWFNETGSLFQIQFLILKDKVSIMIDTTGSPLHKRGYRENSVLAPIKETLAANMVDLSRIRPNSYVVDPMCGSGTLLIESALKAKNIAPGINREFVCQSWKIIDKDVFIKEKLRAKELQRKECTFKARGYDIDKNNISIAKENAEKAGVSDMIEFSVRDINDFNEDSEQMTVICNPPYGERLDDVESARDIYRIMGRRFKEKKGYNYTIISPDEEFEKCFGRKADKRRKLYNGMIRCQVYMYFKSK